MGAGEVLRVEPHVELAGLLHGKLVVLQVVAPDEDPEAVRGLVLEGRQGRRLLRGTGTLAVPAL